MTTEVIDEIVKLSEEMCEKVVRLRGNEDSEKVLVERGKKLQQKNKRKNKFQPRTLNDVQISCCLMGYTTKHKYAKLSPMYEVNLQKTADSYTEVIAKICTVVGEIDENDDIILLTSSGSIIEDKDEKYDTWTLGSYLVKRHLSPEKLALGVAVDIRDSPLEDNNVYQSGSSEISVIKSHDIKRPSTIILPSFSSLEFTEEELRCSTSNFSDQLGNGGFGTVYLAKNLRTKGTSSAVKEGTQSLLKLTPSRQIELEMSALMKFRHPNVVEVMGYCYSKNLKALVYKYMLNGSLFDWLHKSSGSLTWKSKISILVNTIKAIAYLHAATPPVIHQDIKSSNILLDEYFVAKVADFGFAWEVPRSTSGRTMVTAPLIARSDGYYPPEVLTGKVSPLSDIYSYGVVVLEVYTSLLPYDASRNDADLATFLEDHRQDINLFVTVMDTRCSKVNNEVSELFRRIVNECLQRFSKRPSADQVLDMWDINITIH